MAEEEALTRRFGELVRKLRSEQGFSQEGFAYRVGLHRTYVGQIERGEKNVTILTANKLAKALGITLTSMFAELERGSDDNHGSGQH